MNIYKADISYLEDLIPLFDGYRLFYKQKSDLDGVRHFLNERLQKEDSVIFIAYINQQPVGFTQLYHLFSSVSMQQLYLLNDLFVLGNYRGKGIGEALINANQELNISVIKAAANRP
ncbi:MAG: GNAT family N-acetyltransferase [Winogradskyella sp.]|uniref:GNAT family N-acetyltransferase n=1 Tax=Winogradskyella sp. TaxID=1883156 RepID=UPI0017F8BA17|nr:GNAT family N-acetyltransferase [Winogradskyella sp.]MBT8245813.1 GNAT family N-acetyltransferase [Winogradskyella sp.]NNK22584.1 GNAT family N-acetyltransferase [Winogradskyella sp.]